MIATRRAILIAILASCAVAAADGAHTASASHRGDAGGRDAAQPTRPRFFGYNAIFTHTNPSPAAAIREMKAGGSNTTRVMIDWSRVQPTPGGPYHFHFFDRVYRLLLRNGIRPVLVPVGAPCWAHPSVPCSGLYRSVRPDRRYLGAWRRFVTALARRYPRARGFEIWNEPNLLGYWGPHPAAWRYLRLLRAAVRGIDTVKHHPPIAMAGPGPVANWWVFLRREFLQGAAKYSDDIALHLYAHGLPVTRSIVRQLRKADALKRRFDPASGLWITEVGVSTGTVPSFQPTVNPAVQAKALTAIFHKFARRNVSLLTIFRLRDPPAVQAAPGTWQGGLGVEHVDGSPKPAYCALAAAAGAGVPKRCAAMEGQ